MSDRQSQASVDKLFINRFSPKGFSDEPVSKETLLSLFEAARWSPSCFNEQPWFFLYADKKEDLELYSSLLVDVNRAWASSAPVLLFVVARRYFDRNGKVNRHSDFDTGAALMSFSFQAHKLGLYTRAMGGFHLDKAYEALCVPRMKCKIICGVALGYIDDSVKSDERSGRKDLSSIYKSGKFA